MTMTDTVDIMKQLHADGHRIYVAGQLMLDVRTLTTDDSDAPAWLRPFRDDEPTDLIALTLPDRVTYDYRFRYDNQHFYSVVWCVGDFITYMFPSLDREQTLYWQHDKSIRISHMVRELDVVDMPTVIDTAQERVTGVVLPPFGCSIQHRDWSIINREMKAIQNNVE